MQWPASRRVTPSYRQLFSTASGLRSCVPAASFSRRGLSSVPKLHGELRRLALLKFGRTCAALATCFTDEARIDIEQLHVVLPRHGRGKRDHDAETSPVKLGFGP